MFRPLSLDTLPEYLKRLSNDTRAALGNAYRPRPVSPIDDPQEPHVKRATGIGGIFFKAQDTPALRAWYQPLRSSPTRQPHLLAQHHLTPAAAGRQRGRTQF